MRGSGLFLSTWVVLSGCSLVLSPDDFQISDVAPQCETAVDCAPLPRARIACAEGVCGVEACDSGWADCDTEVSNGCEEDVRTTTSCGACGVSCAPAELCDSSGDTPVCSAVCGATVCGDACVDTTSDVAHCGGCERACTLANTVSVACDSSACAIDSCAPGFGDCDADASNGCEEDVRTTTSCGACRVSCASMELCDSTVTPASCTTVCGGTVCGDLCVDIDMNAAHCGGCDRSCDASNVLGARCDAAACVIDTCAVGYEDCDGDPSNGCEVALADDSAHCGACDFACEGDEACVSGRCDPHVRGAAEQHTCVIRASARVYCWGRNSRGQAAPTIYPRWPATPTAVPSSSAPGSPALMALDVAVGLDHSCVIGMDRRLVCWGSASLGRLGIGAPPTSIVLAPEPVTGMAGFEARTFAQVDAEAESTCAVDDLGDVWCWGYNLAGQTGRPISERETRTAARVALPGPAREVEMNKGAACAMLVDGRVFCWGSDARGQLGDGPGVSSTATPVAVDGITTARRIFGHGQTTCVIDTAGALSCWGDNTGGALGARGAGFEPAPVVRESGGVLDAWVSALSLCWRMADGVRCAGRNFEGQFGDGTHEPFSQDGEAPIRLPNLDGVGDGVFAGGSMACGLISGDLRCWGASLEGAVARASLYRATPATVVDEDGSIPTGFRAVGTGRAHACALGVGNVTCWGENSNGQLGRMRPSGSTAESVGGLSDPVGVAVGWISTCAIDRTVSGSEVLCWGANSRLVGGHSGGSSIAPVTLALSGGDAISVTLGYLHGCAVVEASPGSGAGAVWCWGYNASGQLGRDTSGADGLPAAVPGITDAVAVAASGNSTCALHAGGTVSCWGQGAYGVLGNGAEADSLVPVSVSALVNVVEVAGGQQHFCARLDGGALWCWGDNASGQLGDGTRARSRVPVAVDFSASGATSIAGGESHTCATFADGETRCWGAATHDALGGSSADQVRPALVSGGSGASAVGSGTSEGRTSCAVMADSSVSCWGFNAFGAVGSGDTLYFTDTTVVLP